MENQRSRKRSVERNTDPTPIHHDFPLKAPRSEGRTETPYGIPVEVLKRILSHATEIPDVWNLGQVSSIFHALVWENVQKLSFGLEVVYNPSYSNGGSTYTWDIMIKQNPEDVKSLLDVYGKMKKCLPLIWMKSPNLSEVDFGNIPDPDFPVARMHGQPLQAEQAEFLGLVLELQRVHNRRISKIVIGGGFQFYNRDFSTPLASLVSLCCAELRSFQGHDLCKKLDASLFQSLRECEKLESVTLLGQSEIKSGFFRHLAQKNSVREVNFFQTSDCDLQHFLSSLGQGENVLRLDHICRSQKWFNNDDGVPIQFSKITSLAMDLNCGADVIIPDVFKSFPNIKTAMVTCGESWIPVSYDSQVALLLRRFFQYHARSEERKKLAAVIEHNACLKMEFMKMMCEELMRELGVRSEVVEVWRVEETGGVEMERDHQSGDSQPFFKLQMGAVQCFLGPIDVDVTG